MLPFSTNKKLEFVLTYQSETWKFIQRLYRKRMVHGKESCWCIKLSINLTLVIHIMLAMHHCIFNNEPCHHYKKEISFFQEFLMTH